MKIWAAWLVGKQKATCLGLLMSLKLLGNIVPESFKDSSGGVIRWLSSFSALRKQRFDRVNCPLR